MLKLQLLEDPIVQQFLNNPDDMLRIKTERISDELSMQPSLYARAAYLLSLSRQYTSSCKMALEVKSAEIYKKYRQDNAEKTSEIFMKGDDEYKAVRRLLIDAELQENTIKALVDGLQQKKDMLISAATILRQEMQTGIRIMEENVRGIIRKEGDGGY